MNKGPNATIRLVRRQNHAGTTVSWTTVQREKNSHAYKLSSNVQTACSTDSLNNCPKHSILRFSSFALKIYLWLKMCQHNLPCSIVLPTACFPEGPSPHFTFCSFWRRRPRLEAGPSLKIYLFPCYYPSIRGSSNKEWDFFYSAVNLHARLMKFLSKLACLFGCSQVPYSMFYIVPTFVARQH